jgi:hypothetical protein
MRMTDSVRATSEWHRRMTSENLAQNGHKINYNALIPGAITYLLRAISISLRKINLIFATALMVSSHLRDDSNMTAWKTKGAMR